MGEYDVRVVQIEQLDERVYAAQRGREARITAHMRARLRAAESLRVQQRDTFDLIYVPRATTSRRSRRAATRAGAAPSAGDGDAGDADGELARCGRW